MTNCNTHLTSLLARVVLGSIEKVQVFFYLPRLLVETADIAKAAMQATIGVLGLRNGQSVAMSPCLRIDVTVDLGTQSTLTKMMS